MTAAAPHHPVAATADAVQSFSRCHAGILSRLEAFAELPVLAATPGRACESDFLPLAHEILGRNDNHMAALGLSLHMRHAPLPLGHI